MPIYEFRCNNCDHNFEELVSAEKKVNCPKCNSSKVEKQFSTFSRLGGSADSGSFSGGGCSSCSSGNCSSCGAA